jgi:hypothetical protein
MGKNKTEYKILIEEPEKMSMEILGINGSIILKWTLKI